MIPYPDLDMELETFLYQDSTANSCDKCAFVVPGYELSSSLQEAPKNKTELMKLVKVFFFSGSSSCQTTEGSQKFSKINYKLHHSSPG